MAEPARDPSERAPSIDYGQSKNHLRTPPRDDRQRFSRGPQARPVTVEGLSSATAPAARRFASLDALRGFTIFWILGGDTLAWALKEMAADHPGPFAAAGRFIGTQLQHVDWEGFRFYDLIFPMFIFVTGVSIVFSLSTMVDREGRSAARWRVLRRAALLFVLGLIYYGGVSQNWPEIRLLGVLQRIALCYLFASLLFLHLDLRGLVVAFVTLLVGYWALMTFVPVPGVGAGSFSKEANLARWIDYHYLPGQLVHGDWDSEGLLSTLPAVGSCLLGVLAGLLLKDVRLESLQKARWFTGSGIVLVAAGYLWGLQFPVIKPIWTSSFVLVAGGYSLLLLGTFYLLIDVWEHRAWSTVFLWFGANAIALYMINNMVGFQGVAFKLVGGDIYNFLDANVTRGAGSLVNVAVAVTLAIVLARYLYQRQIFVRV